jgi:hypothetical protein
VPVKFGRFACPNRFGFHCGYLTIGWFSDDYIHIVFFVFNCAKVQKVGTSDKRRQTSSNADNQLQNRILETIFAMIIFVNN